MNDIFDLGTTFTTSDG